MKNEHLYIISFFTCQKKEPEPTPKYRLRLQINFKSAPAPAKKPWLRPAPAPQTAAKTEFQADKCLTAKTNVK